MQTSPEDPEFFFVSFVHFVVKNGEQEPGCESPASAFIVPFFNHKMDEKHEKSYRRR